MKVFVIADDQDECDMFKLVLRHTGLEVAISLDLERVLKNWMQNWADLIVLALNERTMILNDIAQVRAITQIPLLLVVNPLPEAQLCAMLQAGADLVLERPVSPRVLASYTQVLLRRAKTVQSFVLSTLELDEITLDPATRTVVVVGQQPRRLTELEFHLLYLLMTNRGQVVPTEVIVERVWGYSGKGDRELVRGLVSRLRRKLAPGTNGPRFIQTIPGVGYRFSLDPPETSNL